MSKQPVDALAGAGTVSGVVSVGVQAVVYACVDALRVHECVGLSPNLNGSVEAGGKSHITKHLVNQVGMALLSLRLKLKFQAQ